LRFFSPTKKRARLAATSAARARALALALAATATRTRTNALASLAPLDRGSAHSTRLDGSATTRSTLGTQRSTLGTQRSTQRSPLAHPLRHFGPSAASALLAGASPYRPTGRRSALSRARQLACDREATVVDGLEHRHGQLSAELG
jgi:hypothetical protein